MIRLMLARLTLRGLLRHPLRRQRPGKPARRVEVFEFGESLRLAEFAYRVRSRPNLELEVHHANVCEPGTIGAPAGAGGLLTFRNPNLRARIRPAHEPEVRLVSRPNAEDDVRVIWRKRGIEAATLLGEDRIGDTVI